MSIEVYTADLTNRHEVTHAISIQMSEYYNAVGKMQMVLPIDDYNIAAFEVGGIVFNVDKNVTYTIENIKYDTKLNRMNVNGYTCNWLLNKRVVRNSVTLDNSASAQSKINAMVTSNLRYLPNITVNAAAPTVTDTVDYVTEKKQLLDEVINALELGELGHRLDWDYENLQHKFKVYKGKDLTTGIHAIVFSEEQGTAQNLIISDDMSDFKNFAYIDGKLYKSDASADDQIITLSVGTAQGKNRFEYYVQGEQSQKKEETLSEFEFRMRGEASSVLAKKIRKQNFQVDIDSTDYLNLYNLGDLVTCSSERFGLAFNARITGVKYTLDVTGAKTALVLGEPTLISLGEVII